MSDQYARSHFLVDLLLGHKYVLGEAAVQLKDASAVEHTKH